MTDNSVEVYEDSTSDVLDIIQNMKNNDSPVFSTMKGDDFETKKAIFAAVSDSEPVGDHLNETFNLANVVAQAVEVNHTDDATGDVSRRTAGQVILITDDGRAFRATSTGILSSLQRLFAILGEPSTWSAPLPVRVVQVNTSGGRRYFTLKLA